MKILFRAFMICSVAFSLIALSKELYYAAIYFMLFALLMQLISMEKEQKPVEYLYADSGMSHDEVDEINSRL
jgi:hypothetical protein